MGIAGPSPRLTVERVRRDVRLTHEAATVIGRALGLNAPPVTVSQARIGPVGKTPGPVGKASGPVGKASGPGGKAGARARPGQDGARPREASSR